MRGLQDKIKPYFMPVGAAAAAALTVLLVFLFASRRFTGVSAVLSIVLAMLSAGCLILSVLGQGRDPRVQNRP